MNNQINEQSTINNQINEQSGRYHHHIHIYIYILLFWCISRLQMVLIALFATGLFRMAKSGHTHQAKLANDR